jgi:hypothetical protein
MKPEIYLKKLLELDKINLEFLRLGVKGIKSMPNEYKPSQNVRIMAGLFLIILSLSFIIGTWYFAITEGYFYPKAALIFPMFLFVGLGVALFPSYRDERIARGEDISNLSGLKLLTFRWWIIFVLAICSGFANFLLLKWF